MLRTLKNSEMINDSKKPEPAYWFGFLLIQSDTANLPLD